MLSISIVVPVLDDAEELAGLLRSLAHGQAHEIIVVDGGSQDDSAPIARSHGAIVLESERGRALQLNHGAARASGDVLLFLHADSRLPPDALASIRAALAEPAVVGGAFSVQIRAAGWSWALLSRAASWRARVSRVPYGDQGIFVRRATFEDLGAFPALPALEDVAFSRQLKRAGRTVQIPEPVTSSARRWQREGLIYTVLRNWIVASLFVAGVPVEKLMRWYPKIR